MGSKYAKVIGKLERDNMYDQSRQDQINEVKAEFASIKTSGNLAEAYEQLRQAKDKQDELLSEIQLRIDAVSQMIEEAYENEGIDSIRLSSGSSVSVQPEPYTRVEDRDANRVWAIKNGYERLLGLPWQTLNSIAKDRLLEGTPPPDGTRLTVRNKIVLRKAKS